MGQIRKQEKRMKKRRKKQAKIILLSMCVLLALGIGIISYNQYIREEISKESSEHLLATYEQVNRTFTLFAERNWNALSDWDNELQKMEEENIICGYHTLINWDKTDIEKVTALIEVSVTPQRGQGFDKIAERIYNYPEVNAVYLISGSYDLLVTIEGRTLREAAQFVSDKLSPLESVLSTKTNFILKKYKDYGTILVEDKEERMLVTP